MDWRIIFKYNLEKEDMEVWAESKYFTIGFSTVILYTRRGTDGFHECGKFYDRLK
jgi:hypothetical protein